MVSHRDPGPRHRRSCQRGGHDEATAASSRGELGDVGAAVRYWSATAAGADRKPGDPFRRYTRSVTENAEPPRYRPARVAAAPDGRFYAQLDGPALPTHVRRRIPGISAGNSGLAGIPRLPVHVLPLLGREVLQDEAAIRPADFCCSCLTAEGCSRCCCPQQIHPTPSNAGPPDWFNSAVVGGQAGKPSAWMST